MTSRRAIDPDERSGDDVSETVSNGTDVDSSKRTLLKAAGLGGGLALAGGGLTGSASAQTGGLKAYSGILRVSDDARRGGEAFRAVIPFADYPEHRSSLPPDDHAEMRVPRQAGGSGPFFRAPAYMAHIREYQVEDKAGVGNSETDRWTIDTDVNPLRLVIDWSTDEGNSFVEEIGFLVVGV